jgi:hypothetical protein
MAGWKLALLMIWFTPLILLAGKLQSQKQSRAGRTEKARLGDEQGQQVRHLLAFQLIFFFQFSQMATEAIENIRTLIALNQQNNFFVKYQHSLKATFRY